MLMSSTITTAYRKIYDLIIKNINKSMTITKDTTTDNIFSLPEPIANMYDTCSLSVSVILPLIKRRTAIAIHISMKTRIAKYR